MRPRRSPHPRRLRPRAPRRRRPSRSARNPRRAVWTPIDDRHLTAPAVRLAPGHRRSHLRRRHPRPPRAQRTSHRTQRREPPAHPGQATQNGLTQNEVRWKKLPGQQARRPGRDHLVTGGRHHPGIPGRNHPVIDGRVGTAIAPRPPHRSGRASFSHPALPEVYSMASAGLARPERVTVGIGNG